MQSFDEYRKDFLEIQYVGFEFLKIPIPKGYKRILDMKYGDWKKYVIGSDHGQVLYNPDISYINIKSQCRQ